LNHGEKGLTQKPDSACGKYYTASSSDNCVYHSGFIQKNGTWSCCQKDKGGDGCVTGSHKSADWPDKEAKLYFYPKPVLNPGINHQVKDKKKGVLCVGDLIARCDYFKVAAPYDNPITKMELLKAKKEREKDMIKYCINWGCEKVFKEVENLEGCCLYHPGRWDHGSTGTKMTEFIREIAQDPKNVQKKTILWTSHWTCCRKEWENKGCKRGKHRGFLLEEMDANKRPYQHPDPRAKLYFPKVVTEKWKKSLEGYKLNEQQVIKKCTKFWESKPVKFH
jgi:hypothetical protein